MIMPIMHIMIVNHGTTYENLTSTIKVLSWVIDMLTTIR